ncbi:DUF3891 family protein [Hymenobacter sp. BT175]|uniref:DUF3891 family protein n=1 Tax=Hymenobacter translucens TaxID=2886507 RepID=UPI001D0F3029|nr:DUF3891 family protein [Hymenobacter translucens]MCC2547601.1 DUF3891 family protein [Hymenobacter translucens]
MIIRETPTSFIYITQPDHAHVSGQMATHWQPALFPDAARRVEVELAVREHDRAWATLDTVPIWNEPARVPHSFLDYPAAPKIRNYQQGVDEMEALAPYAGLLGSLHFTSFPDLGKTGEGRQFLQHEANRQARLRRELRLDAPAPAAALDFHLQLLRFLDRLSLYLCLNEPGAPKDREHPWYQKGIPLSDYFPFAGGQMVQAVWHGPQAVQVAPSPFDTDFFVRLRYRELPKASLSARTLADCFRHAPTQELVVQIRR